MTCSIPPALKGINWIPAAFDGQWPPQTHLGLRCQQGDRLAVNAPRCATASRETIRPRRLSRSACAAN